MLSHDKINSALQDRNLSAIKRSTHISLHTIIKMKKGNFDNLSASSVRIVSEYLERTGVKDGE